MIKAITTADLQQLAQGQMPAYLQRYPLPELVQELAERLLYAERVINDARYTRGKDAIEEITAKLEEYDECKELD